MDDRNHPFCLPDNRSFWDKLPRNASHIKGPNPTPVSWLLESVSVSTFRIVWILLAAVCAGLALYAFLHGWHVNAALTPADPGYWTDRP